MDFKKKVLLSKRMLLSDRMKNQYNTRIPIILICDKSLLDNNIVIPNSKYLLPKDIALGHFMMNIKNKIKMNPNHSFVVFINNELPIITSLMGDLYEKYKDPDGFLYITIAIENVFG
jgi:GABA(A) receptor-associated protein